MKITIRLIVSPIMLLMFVCCSTGKGYLSRLPHLRWTEGRTSLSEKLNIDGCFYDDVSGAMHFYEDGTVAEVNGYRPGVYKVVGDTIITEVYWREGMLIAPRWHRFTSQYLIVSRDTIKYIGHAWDAEGIPQWGVRPTKREYISVRFDDCPENFKVRDNFLRKQKWMWESEEARKQWLKNRKNRD